MLFDRSTSLAEVFERVREELRVGALQNDHPFRLFVLSTVGADSRHVVLRRISGDIEICFFTDSRTSKVGQILKNPDVSALFYHGGKRFQVRVKAKARIHHQDEVSASYWGEVKGEARKAYGSLVYPGHRIAAPTDAHQWPEIVDERFFAVVILSITKLDVMQLDGLTHLRAEFVKRGENWEMHWLAP